MQNDINISEIIRSHRKQAALSQVQLAAMAGVARAAVQQLEAGKLSIQINTLLKICEVLNIRLRFESPLSPATKKASDND